MEKTVEEYIRELKNMAQKSIYKDNVITTVAPPKNEATGNLIISVTHSQNTLPVPDAQFRVYDKNGNLAREGKTDKSGKSEVIELAAINKNISERPGTNLINSAVFYDVSIEAKDYIPFTIKNIPIYEGITTLQNFDMTFFAASPDGLPQTITLPTDNTL